MFGTPLFDGKAFVSEDERLVHRIKQEVQNGKLNEIIGYFWGSAQEFLSTFKNPQR